MRQLHGSRNKRNRPPIETQKLLRLSLARAAPRSEHPDRGLGVASLRLCCATLAGRYCRKEERKTSRNTSRHLDRLAKPIEERNYPPAIAADNRAAGLTSKPSPLSCIAIEETGCDVFGDVTHAVG